LTWFLGLTVAVLAIVVTVLLIQRARAAPKVSLITRSLDREKK
jgi:hypothetical protein